MSVQAPGDVLLVRPHHFRVNPETPADNAFQASRVPARVAAAAFEASTEAARRLEAAGVRVHVFDDLHADRPDSVFPNNWFSTHTGGRVALYPMYARNRRAERRSDVVEFLKREYRVQEVVDYSGFERDGLFLEGTGAMVLDHIARIAYTARSRRADPRLLERFCTAFGYEPMLFDAADASGIPIYHTNVMMCLATDFALVTLDAVTDPGRRSEIAHRLHDSGRHVVPLSASQMADFAGNAIELRGHGRRRVLAMSVRAEASLTARQREVIEDSCTLLPIDVAPMELSGGSVRCMIAGLHLERRTPQPTPGQTGSIQLVTNQASNGVST